jgi:SulP family sulfate permease
MDATGLHALEDIMIRLKKRGAQLLLSGVHAQPLIAFERSGLLEQMGEDSMFASFDEAVDRATELARRERETQQ